ncbi:MAG TPA: hypothetical protein VEA69_06945 [Tepidisphaeraceae bacterium]|nr:hypothetical protein [Tepidisphaeraceae bacterium]
MSTTTTITREQYLAMSPDHYLAAGFRDAAGQPRHELTSVWATAGAVQLEHVAPAQLGTVLTALGQTLPLHAGTPADHYANACAEAVELATGVLGAEPDPAVAQWLARFAPLLKTEQDLRDLVQHLGVVARQHAMFAGMRAGSPKV